MASGHVHSLHYWSFVRIIHRSPVVSITKGEQLSAMMFSLLPFIHDDVIKSWKHFPRYWPFVRGIHRSRWIPRTKASDAELGFSLICAWINAWVNNREVETPSRPLWRHCNVEMQWRPCDVTITNMSRIKAAKRTEGLHLVPGSLSPGHNSSALPPVERGNGTGPNPENRYMWLFKFRPVIDKMGVEWVIF